MSVTAIHKKKTKWLPFKNKKSEQLESIEHILDVYVHIHVKDEVSMPTHMDRRAYKRKLPKWLPFKNYKSESLNI